MKPIFVPDQIKKYLQLNRNDGNVLHDIKAAYTNNLATSAPLISVVMPAYNEEENIVPTLASLCDNITSNPVEIIVVNNNSQDNTVALVKACGVTCIDETKQGITNARNKGLSQATGKYILNADADTIYPRDWIEEMTKPLINNQAVAITYGTFAFIPIGSTGRITYYIYEWLAELTRFYNRFKKTEAVNVYGFNSGFRREQGLQVNGFDHPPGTNEDGYLALKLTQKGFGKMYRVGRSNAIVWTTDRRIQIDGGLWKAISKRSKRLFNIK
jgi:glycosyltransferase involved in cell wall biosynthesis